MDEFLEQFLIESRELVASAVDDLTALEDRPGDKDRLDSAFRAFHTLKGGAGIVDFHAMARALHTAEDVLSAVRAGHRALTPQMIGDFLGCLDQVVRWIDATERTGAHPANADIQANAIVEIFTNAGAMTAASSTVAADAPAAGTTLTGTILEEQRLLAADDTPQGRDGRWTSAANVAANVLRRSGNPADAEAVITALAQALERGVGDALVQAIGGAMRGLVAPQPAQSVDSAARTFRVDAARLDELVNLAGELSVAKNAAGHILRLARDGGNPLTPALRDHHLVMEKLVASLQHAVLTIRVLPVRHLFQRFQRLVRETAATLGKPVRLVTAGEDTEADKAIIEALYEPLLHLLRNAMDHGIETARQRRGRGKPEIATIALRAARQADVVVIEVADDGDGIDLAKVRAVALARGLGSAREIDALSDAETIDLIFQPGFSTATAVTEHSGRGVGMDAVRSALARMGGRVVLESIPRQGTTVRLTLPFSVVMTQVMTVMAGGQYFGIPLETIAETLRVPRHRIQQVGNAHAVVHRDRTLPVIDLSQLLDEKAAPRADFGNKAEVTLVKVSLDGLEGAFEVDRLGERLDIMLKPLSGLLKGTPGITGTTLLGDGSVLIVLDVGALLS